MKSVHATSQWTLQGQDGVESLVLKQKTLPELGDFEVLVRIHAASLNYRDLVIAKGGKSHTIRPDIVPGSDGAGIVTKVGSAVKSFKEGDKVCTHLIPAIGDNEFPTMSNIIKGLGQDAHGTICEYGIFNEGGLVPMPDGVTFEEASTLTCSALTAWNALHGLSGKEVKKGDFILVQGTGGVSIAALQFAKAAGATVIATTSSTSKTSRLRDLGADHVINYREDQNWGETAKSLTNGRGVDNIVDVGGLSTLSQSLKAVAVEGVITLTGILGGSPTEEQPSLLDCLWNVCMVRGIVLGTKAQFRDMNKAIEEYGIKPVVDDKIFDFNQVKEAYGWLEEQMHFSKVVIRIP